MRGRSLWPREHGAYVQLSVPLVVALAVYPSVAGAFLTLAACAAFVAHEPLLVMSGRRGRRAQELHRDRARRRIFGVGAIAIAAGVAGLVLAPWVVPAAAVMLVAALGVGLLSWRGEAHTLGGELVAAATLALAAAPVALAGDATLASTVNVWLMWSLAFASTVVAVHVVIVSHKGRADRRTWIFWGALLAACGAALALGWTTDATFGRGAPLWATSVAIAAVRPRANHLRRVGVLLAVVTSASAIWAILG